MKYRVLNLQKYQPYWNGRGGSWCKLHKKILRSKYGRLDNASWRLGLELIILALDEEPDDDDHRWVDCDPAHLSWALSRKITQDHLDALQGVEFLASRSSLPAPDLTLIAQSKTQTQIDRRELMLRSVPQSSTKPVDFEAFWALYPRKVGKKAALKAWNTHKPPISKCLAVLEVWRKSEAWTKDNGAYIPHPSTWINAGRWDDEIETEKPKFVNRPLTEAEKREMA